MDITTTTQIRQRFKSQKIKCIKYNYSLDANVQTECQFDGFIQLS